MYFLLAFHKYNDSFKRFKKLRRYRLDDTKTTKFKRQGHREKSV